jgi:hypothetical protein
MTIRSLATVANTEETTIILQSSTTITIPTTTKMVAATDTTTSTTSTTQTPTNKCPAFSRDVSKNVFSPISKICHVLPIEFFVF